MWDEGAQQKIIPVYQDYNVIAKGLKGDLDDKNAKITLIQFLRRNLGFTFELISGMRLLPQQEIVLKSLFARDTALIVAGRGFGKSTIIAMFCCLYPIFYPNSKICLISANFRGARRIFEAAEKMVKGPFAYMLQECFPTEPRRLNDIISWKLENGSEVFALPLSNGEGLRGTRASAVFVDEGLLISQEIQENVIRPFLTAKQNFLEEAQMKEREDELIKAGLITETDRISFPRNKYLVCSSASYDFDYLYKTFQSNIKMITDDKIVRTKDDSTYVVIRSSYESLPKDSFIDMTQINAAKADGGEETDYFKREYQARFTVGGSSYFNMKKVADCTVRAGEFPTTMLRGRKNHQYILTIDPSYSSSKNSDFFAMGVYELVPDSRRIILVHSYGRAGMTLNDHYKYLVYLLTHFNIVWLGIDASGTEFIDSFNESVIAADKGIKLGTLTADLKSDEYIKELRILKNEYNQTTRNIVYPQPFSGDTIRRMNEYLQAGINAEKVWFASLLQVNENAFNNAMRHRPDAQITNKHGKPIDTEEQIYEQDSWIHETQKQLSLIEVKSTALGTMQFDLPSHIKNSTKDDRARRDNYTCMLMAYTASKYYFDMLFTEVEEIQSTFEPFAI